VFQAQLLFGNCSKNVSFCKIEVALFRSVLWCFFLDIQSIYRGFQCYTSGKYSVFFMIWVYLSDPTIQPILKLIG